MEVDVTENGNGGKLTISDTTIEEQEAFIEVGISQLIKGQPDRQEILDLNPGLSEEPPRTTYTISLSREDICYLLSHFYLDAITEAVDKGRIKE